MHPDRTATTRAAKDSTLQTAMLAVAVTSTFFLLFSSVKALGAEPVPWQMGMQDPASPVMHHIFSLHSTLTWIMSGVVVVVFGLLAYVIWRFNEQRNPVAAKFSHNTKLEIIWTSIPVLILASIALPSFNLLYYMDRAHEAEMTIKVVGHQWYWSYEYPDHDGIAFDAFMVDADSLAPGQPRLLTTDNPVVLPVDTDIRVLMTADDVIHSWAVPALGLKTDTVPGRTNESWVRIERPGTYYGQCSELCGVNHGFMPIMVKAVPKEEFAAWVTEAKVKFAAAAPTTQLAASLQD